MIAFKLYLCADTEKHRAFAASVREALKKLFDHQFRLDVFNVLDNSERAVEDAVLVTPTLIKAEPHPVQRFVGDFNSVDALERLLCGK